MLIKTAVIAVMMLGFSFMYDINTTVSAQVCPAINAATFPAAPYSNFEIDCMLRSGVDTAYAWDECRTEDFLPNAAFFSGNIREMINGFGDPEGNSPTGGCGYSSATWLSGRNVPNAVIPISVPYGTTSIPLQINYVKYINGPLVAADLPASGGWRAIYNDIPRWALASNTALGRAIDRAPNRIDTYDQYPAHVESRTRITNFAPSYRVAGPTTGALTMSGGLYSVLAGDRAANPGSRFWFARAPVNSTLNIAGGIQGPTSILVEMDYQRMDGVFKNGGGNFEYLTLCAAGANRQDTWGSTTNFSRLAFCTQSSMTLRIDVVLTNSFNLVPSIAAVPGISQPGDTITAAGSIRKTGSTASYSDTESTVTRLTYNPGSRPTQTAVDSNLTPCAYFVGAATCTLDHVLRNGAITAATTNLATRAETIALGTQIGSRICYVTSVTRQDQTGNPAWAHSNPTCTVVASAPRMTIVGGDAASGGSFTCDTTQGGFRGAADLPGSFGEYGLLVSPGSITEFGSAAQSNGRALSFANNPAADDPGEYNTSRCVANLEPKLTSGVVFSNYTGGALPGNGNWRASGDITISASSLTSGRQVLIVADPGRTVTISGNLTYAAGPYARYADVPSLTIIADTIRVNSNVTQIDGLFIARGNMTTCTEAGSSKTAVQTPGGLTQIGATGPCRANRLQVNGAIITNGELVTARSAGGDSPGAAPAEIYTFRPEIFLGPVERSASDASLKTDMETELPPRN